MHYSRYRFYIALVLSLATISWNTVSLAQAPTLGSVDFPNSGAKAAQADFVKGILYLHSFEYAPARTAFKKAQMIDPNFTMAYWGEAMTYHHSLWRVQDQPAAQDVLRRLGRTTSDEAAKIPTQREKDYVHALEILFGMTEATANLGKLERDVHYRDAMKQVHLSYPDDLEARAFYGLSILGVGSANREYASYMRAAAVITPVWDANRTHPGAAHYLIHSYDDPVHAILGLPMARAYEKIAVDAAHAQHMTSHIYVALGYWDDMTAANTTALKVESAKTSGEGARSREAWHHRYWLHYGRLQQGRLDDARKMLLWARNRIDSNPLPREPEYYGAMYARYLIDTELWAEADEWLTPDGVDVTAPHYAFAQAYAAAKLGNTGEARSHLAEISKGGTNANPEIILSEQEVDILKLQIRSLIALNDGDSENAIALARRAARIQSSTAFRYGPPRISKPSSEFLAELLLNLGNAKEASEVFIDQLSRSQLRSNALIGLLRSSTVIGDEASIKESTESLKNIWHGADRDFPLLVDFTGSER